MTFIKKFKSSSWLYASMATSLVMLAQLIVKPASALYIYQGDVPKELLKKEE